MAQSTYQSIALTSDLDLTWPSSFTGGPVVMDINDIDPDQAGWVISLPDATLVSAGQNFIFNNISGFSFEIVAQDLITPIATVASGDIVNIYLTDSTTANGEWRAIPSGGGANAITQFTAESTDSSVSITNGTVTPPTGTIDFKLPDSIFNLASVNTDGFLVAKSVSPLDYQTRELIGGENIIVSDGDGILSDPVIDVNPVMTSMSSITVGDMTLSGEVITNNTANGNIQINTSGTGQIQLNGLIIDTDGNIGSVTNLTGPKAYCNFTDTLVGMSNTIVVEQQVNIASVTGSNGSYELTFTTAMPTINYGVLITLGSTGGNLPFISNGYYIVRELTSVTIIVTDASGELVLSVPHGVTVIVMSS